MLTDEVEGRLGRPLSEDPEFWRAAPEVALQWITYTTSTVSGIPDGVRWICRQLMEELTKQYGNSANSSELTVAHFLFDMYFRPGIINPGSYGMMDGRKKLSRQGNLCRCCFFIVQCHVFVRVR